MNSVDVIANPEAGRGAARAALSMVRPALEQRGIPYTLQLTREPGHATVLARESSASVVVALGGDGTVNEVANGLCGSHKTLGVIPAGSGNDFVKAAGLGTDPAAIVDMLVAGRTRMCDAGVVSTGSPGNSSPRYFVNGVGMGFDAAVAVRTSSIRYLRGTALYVVAVLQTLGKFEAPACAVSVDDVVQRSNNLLVAIGNGHSAGGGFLLTPDAVIDDGELDICIITGRSIPGILRIMPKVMRGKHRGERGVTLTRGRKINITSETPFFVHADGEIVGHDVQHVSVQIKPGALRIITK